MREDTYTNFNVCPYCGNLHTKSHFCEVCKERIAVETTLTEKTVKTIIQKTGNAGICGAERPNRKTLCQLRAGHRGSHTAVMFWE